MSLLSIKDKSPNIFFMPLAYFVTTRLESVIAIASWVMIYPLPILLSILLLTPDLMYLSDALAVIFAMLSVYSIYELGYMDNDARTVAREAQPTQRMTRHDKEFWARKRWLVILVRLLFVVACLFAIQLMVPGNIAGKIWFLAALGVIALVFPVYNSTRGAVNLPLHFLLVTARFAGPGLVLVGWDRPAYLLVMVFAFPLINLLERSGEARYGLAIFAPVLVHRHLFRTIYYLVLTLLAILLWQSGQLGVGVVLFLGYWFVYRLVSPLLVRF